MASQGENKRRRLERTTIQSLGQDILCCILVNLDAPSVARCSAVCKFWNVVITRSDLLRQQFYKSIRNDAATSSLHMSDKSTYELLKELAMQNHWDSMCRGSVLVDLWKGHAVGGYQCRMRSGVILTGGSNDKVIRLWSSENYKCLEEYPVPAFSPLIDFEFDEHKIVGLLGTHLCIWRRNGKMTLFPPHEATSAKGTCMRYIDPEAVVGCEDGRAYIFDMYSRTCSQIIRMHSSQVTSLALGEDRLIMSGSSLGEISLYGPSFDRNPISLRLDRTGIRTLCYNPSSHLLFAGSSTGSAYCWDLRMMVPLWHNQISNNMLYSVGYLCNDTSTLVAGGIDGILRVIDQYSGEVVARYVIADGLLQQRRTSGSTRMSVLVEHRKGRRVTAEASMDLPVSVKPPVRCLAVGMNKVVTTHTNGSVRLWKFQQRNNWPASTEENKWLNKDERGGEAVEGKKSYN